MAQVKKLQQGGTLNINGKEYTVDQINEYLSSGQFNAQERESLAGTVRAIQEGKSRYLDVNSNSLSGDGNVNEDFADYFGSERRANRGRSGWSNRKQDRHANRNSDFAVRDRALAKLGNIENYLSNQNTAPTAGPTKLGKGNGWFYTNGKYVSGPQNLTNEKHIQDVFSYLGSDDENKKAWELSGWGDSMNALQNWYNGQDVNGLLDRIRKNMLTDEDKEVLSFMGYTPTQEDVVSSEQSLIKDKFQKAGYDYDKWSGIIDIDDNGNAIVRTGEDGKTAFSSLGGNGNYFFNDSFVSNNPNYSFLKDHFVIDGKVYKASDANIEGSDLYNILRSSGGFYDKNRSGDWEGADQIIKHLWDGRKNYTLGNSDVYSSFLTDNPNYRWTSITGAYDVPLSPGEQLIEYYDPTDVTDAYGYGKARWAVLDADGNFIRNVDSRGNITGSAASPLTGKKIVKTAAGNSTYDGLVIEDLTDIDGESTGTTLFKDPNSGDFIYRGRIRGANIDENQDYIVPKSIAQILSKSDYQDKPGKPGFWSKLKNNKRLQRQFERTLGDTVNSGFRDMFTWNTMSVEDWMELGISKDDAITLVNEFEKYASNSEKQKRSVRRANRLIKQVEIQKNGGNIPMFQPGGAVGTNTSKGHTEKRLSTNYQNADDFASFGDGEWEGLTGADWAEIGALAADMAGLGLGLTGAPIASGVAGAIGSTTAFGADLSRDTDGDGKGFEWGDVGNYALNLGLDAISLLPFAGSAAQGAKAAKGIKTAGKTVLKLLSNPKVVKGLAATGVIGAAQTSAQKIINDEEWTVRDIRNVLNGLSGALTLRKTGIAQGSGTKGKKVEQGSIDVKIKGSDTVETVPLKKDVLDAVNKPNTTDVDVQLKKAIVSELNAKGKNVTIDDIDLTPARVQTKRTWRHPIKGEATDSYDFQIREVTEPGELLPTIGPESTRRGVTDQFNNWLKTGDFVEVQAPHQYRGLTGEQAQQLPSDKVWVGKPLEYGDDFKSWRLDYDVPGKKTSLSEEISKAFKKSMNPFAMTPEQRRLLRRTQIFTPNLTSRGDDISNQQPIHFIPVPVSVPSTKLSELSSMKNGGILKAENGLKFSDLTLAQQEEFKRLKAEAESSGKSSFEFNGQIYNVSKPLPTTGVTITGSPAEADLNNDANWKKVGDGTSSIYTGPGEFKYSGTSENLPEILTSTIPSDDDTYNNFMSEHGLKPFTKSPHKVNVPNFVNVNEEVVNEPSLYDDLKASGASRDTLNQVKHWQKIAADDAASKVAGNPPGDLVIDRGGINLSDTFRIGKLLNAFNADKYQQKMAWKNYFNARKGVTINPIEFYNRYQDFGLGEQYKQAATNLIKPIVNVHSDVNSMYADQRTRNEKANQLLLEGGLKQSQLYADWLDQIDTAKKSYTQKRTENAMADLLRARNAESALWTNLGASRAQRQNVIDNFLTEQLGLYTQDRAMNYQIADQNDVLNYKTGVNNIKSEYQQKLKNAINSGVVPANATLDDYFNANPNEYEAYIKQLNDLQQTVLQNRLDNYRRYNKQSIFSAKSGGKVNKRSASDQIWIDNQKKSAKAVEQLSKQAFEFLKTALS